MIKRNSNGMHRFQPFKTPIQHLNQLPNNYNFILMILNQVGLAISNQKKHKIYLPIFIQLLPISICLQILLNSDPSVFGCSISKYMVVDSISSYQRSSFLGDFSTSAKDFSSNKRFYCLHRNIPQTCKK